VQEALAAAFRLRANTLLAGIKSMLNDPRFDGLAQCRLRASAGQSAQRRHPADERRLRRQAILHRTGAFRDCADRQHPAKCRATSRRSRRAIDAIPDPQVRRAMQGLYARAAATCSNSRHAGRLVRQCDAAHVRQL
jgi:hypothetical protein